jgi:hypothetical protein
VNPVLFREAFDNIVFVLPEALLEITRDSDVEGSIALAG